MCCHSNVLHKSCLAIRSLMRLLREPETIPILHAAPSVASASAVVSGGRTPLINLSRIVSMPPGEESRMWETCSVQLTVRLPRDIALEAEEIQRMDPEFLSRVILYGLTRLSIYRQLREQNPLATSSHW